MTRYSYIYTISEEAQPLLRDLLIYYIGRLDNITGTSEAEPYLEFRMLAMKFLRSIDRGIQPLTANNSQAIMLREIIALCEPLSGNALKAVKRCPPENNEFAGLYAILARYPSDYISLLKDNLSHGSFHLASFTTFPSKRL